MLPTIAPFPPESIVRSLPAEEWGSIQQLYSLALEIRLRLDDVKFTTQCLADKNLTVFLAGFVQYEAEQISSGSESSESVEAVALRRNVFRIVHRMLHFTKPGPPKQLLEPEFLRDLCRIYPNSNSLRELFGTLWKNHPLSMESAVSALVSAAVRAQASTKSPELVFSPLLPLIKTSPEAAQIFIGAEDFTEILYKEFEQHRGIVLKTLYILLGALLDPEKANVSQFSDQMYSLTHAHEPILHAMISSTPLVDKLRLLGEINPRASTLYDNLISKYEGQIYRPRSKSKSKDKGKARAESPFPTHPSAGPSSSSQDLSSEIASVLQIFPDLSISDITSHLNAAGNNVEQTISRILEGEPVPTVPVSTSPPRMEQPIGAPSRFRPIPKTAQILQDTTPNRLTAAPKDLSSKIFQLLEDDEHDDTYDAVDTSIPGPGSRPASPSPEDRILYSEWTQNPGVFKREARKSRPRLALLDRLGEGWTDETIEGWAVMLEREPARERMLGSRAILEGGRNVNESGAVGGRYRKGVTEGTEFDRGRGGRGRGRGGRGRGGGRGGGADSSGGGESSGGGQNVPNARGRARKERGGNRARREGHMRKMARGGALPT